MRSFKKLFTRKTVKVHLGGVFCHDPERSRTRPPRGGPSMKRSALTLLGRKSAITKTIFLTVIFSAGIFILGIRPKFDLSVLADVFDTEMTIESMKKKDYLANEPIIIKVTNAKKDEINITLTHQNGQEVPADIQKVNIENGVNIQIAPTSKFKPGKYRVEISNDQGEIKEEEFTWGVLAINPNKSIYLPNETANLAMAVLDETGMMVCDALLRLKIQASDGEPTYLSTEDGSIIVNPECQIHNYTVNPDYQAKYQVANPGLYQMELTAETSNGSYTVKDNFEVREEVKFDIERRSATRIYPPATYPMTINITANENFSGTIEEVVPSSFEISENSSTSNYSQIITQGDSKIIYWQVNLIKGEQISLGYSFDAPNISPEFYLLGPLTLIDSGGGVVFNETRQWQIAADAYVGNIFPADPDINANWSLTGAATHWDAVNDGGTSPDTGDYIYAAGNLSTTDRWNMDTISMGTGATATGIQVWAYGYDTKDCDITTTLYWTGGNSSGQLINVPLSAYGWASTTFTGLTLTQTQLDSLSIDLGLCGAGGRTVYVATVYATVTYEYEPPEIDVTGNVYSDEAGTPTVWSTCDGSTSNISLAINGVGVGSTSCDNSTGAFSFTVSNPSAANQVVVVYFDTNGGDKGALYTKNNDTTSDITGLTLTKNRIWIQSESSESITNTNINVFDQTNDSDIPAASDGTNMDADTGTEIHINTADVYAPGGNVNIDNIHLEGTYTGASETLTLEGSGTGACTTEPGTIRPLCIEGGTFTATSNTTSFQGTTNSDVEATTYSVLQFNPASGTPTFYLNTGSIAVGNSFTLTGAANIIVDAETSDPNLDIGGNVTIGSGDEFQASSTGNFNVAGDWDNNGTFTDNNSTLVFDAATTGKTIESGGSSFYAVQFNNSAGGWTIQTNNFTTADNLTITDVAASGLTVDSVTVEVQGAYGVADAETANTTWTSAILYLNATTAADYTIGSSSQSTEVYSTLQIGANNDIRTWNSSASTYIVDSTGSLYSQDHAANDGDVYLWGDYHTQANDYWSYATDFDGTDISGTPRQVDVAIDPAASVTVDSADTLAAIGVGSTVTAVTRQGASNGYQITVADGGTVDFQYTSFNYLDGPQGIDVQTNATVTSLSNTSYDNLVGTTASDDAFITVASTVIGSGTKTISNVQFDNNGSGAEFNVNRTGDDDTGYWDFDGTSGTFDGESFDGDDGSDEADPGMLKWDDSAVSGPTVDQQMRHGMWFDSGTEQEFTF